MKHGATPGTDAPYFFLPPYQGGRNATRDATKAGAVRFPVEGAIRFPVEGGDPRIPSRRVPLAARSQCHVAGTPPVATILRLFEAIHPMAPPVTHSLKLACFQPHKLVRFPYRSVGPGGGWGHCLIASNLRVSLIFPLR